VAKRTKPRQVRRKPAVKTVKARVDKTRVGKPKVDTVRVDKAKVAGVQVDKVRTDKKCLGCSAERTERIKYRTAIIALVAGVLGLSAGILLFGRVVVEARNQQAPPAAPLYQSFECAPVISVTVPAAKIAK
jgi:hypothetical protein